jgi:hypothetical protein
MQSNQTWPAKPKNLYARTHRTTPDLYFFLHTWLTYASFNLLMCSFGLGCGRWNQLLAKLTDLLLHFDRTGHCVALFVQPGHCEASGDRKVMLRLLPQWRLWPCLFKLPET